MYLPLALLVIGASRVYSNAYPPVIPTDLETPVQQRIAIRSPTQISVAWNTYRLLFQPCVEYGTSATNLSSKACSSASITHSTSRTHFNTVHLVGLKPATTYYYKIVSTNSSVEQFFSPRVPGDTTPFAINAVIDLGVYGSDGYTIGKDRSFDGIVHNVEPSLNHTTISRLVNTLDKFELVIHPGDLAYADNWFQIKHNQFDGTNAYESILEQFYGQLAPISGVKPYMAGPGNHEAGCEQSGRTSFKCADGQRNFGDFDYRFGSSMPKAFTSTSMDTTAKINANKAAVLASPPFWYSFEYGMAHITMIDTETDFPEAPDGLGGSAQYHHSGPFGLPKQQLQFLEADLASVDRTVTPWLIVAGHRPWYATGKNCKPCQVAFEDLLYKYGVDLVVSGHIHSSQRIKPIYGGVVDPNGLYDPKAPMYIVAGGAGNIEGLDRHHGKKPNHVAWMNDSDFGYSTLSFLDKNRLKVDFINSYTGGILDSATLLKSHAEAFVRQ